MIEKLIETHRAALKRYALSLTKGNKHDADDLLQDTLIKIITKQEQYEEQGKFAQWSHRLMLNTFRDKCRKKSRENISSLEYNESWTEGTEEELELDTVENEAISKLTIEEINTCISNLKEDYKQVVIMRLEGYTFKEIEKLLQMNASTVRSKYFKAIKILRIDITNKLGD